MEIEFDPAKDAINIAKHGLSLAEAATFELSSAYVQVDDRFEYGEIRFRAFGRVGEEGRCLVFTWNLGKIRVISFRRAREKEMRRYE